MMKQIAIVTPVLDDWESLVTLIAEISAHYTGSGVTFHVFAVDDGSNEAFDIGCIRLPADTCVASIEILRLSANLGHQRAIAIGLVTYLGIGFVQTLLPHRPGAAAALFSNSGQVGSVVAALGAGALAQAFGYSSIFIACAILSAAGLVMICLVRPEPD